MTATAKPRARNSRKPTSGPSSAAYAIGDIHGQGDLAHALLQHIVDEIAETPGRRSVIIALGDYVDRGPNSNYVLQILHLLKAFEPIETHLLKGNHEAAMIAFLEGRDSGAAWMEYGGLETLASYGVPPPALPTRQAREATRLALLEAMPADHQRLLQELELSFSWEGYFFAHAGAAPGIGLDEQAPEDLMWIRGRFLGSDHQFERVVVHGHTPSPDVHSDHRRVGIDTGAYLTGILTALRLEGAGRELIQAVRTPDGVEIRRRAAQPSV